MLTLAPSTFTRPVKLQGAGMPHGAALMTRAVRLNVNFAVFVDGEGPGSGQRHAPSPGEYGSRNPGPADKFDLLSAEEMETMFPKWVHASSPPAIVDREPSGLTALHTPDAGPTTGLRRRPSFISSGPASKPTLPYPVTGPAADLQRDLQIKKKILSA